MASLISRRRSLSSLKGAPPRSGLGLEFAVQEDQSFDPDGCIAATISFQRIQTQGKSPKRLQFHLDSRPDRHPARPDNIAATSDGPAHGRQATERSREPGKNESFANPWKIARISEKIGSERL